MRRVARIRNRVGRAWSVAAVTLTMLGAAGCTSPAPDQAQNESSLPSSPPSAPAASTSSGDGASSSSGTGPSNSLGFDSSHQLTQAEAMVLYREALAQSAKASDLKSVPAVAFVRFIEPSEQATTVVACLNELGLPAQANSDGNGYSIPGSVPDSQKDFINESQYKCEAMYPIHPQFELPPSTVSLGRQYDWLVTKQMPCYRAEGFPVPDPPSKAVWIASYTTDPWYPEQAVPKDVLRNSQARAKLEQKCPPPGVDDFLEHPPVIKK